MNNQGPYPGFIQFLTKQVISTADLIPGSADRIATYLSTLTFGWSFYFAAISMPESHTHTQHEGLPNVASRNLTNSCHMTNP
jgi:hypothetical protein